MYRFSIFTLLLVSGYCYSLKAFSQTLEPTSPIEKARQDVANDRERRLDGMNIPSSPAPKPKLSPDQLKSRKEAAEKLAQLRQVNPEDELKYKQFLAAGDGGLFQLVPDFDCNTDFSVNTLRDCRTFVSGSSNYSFRARGYSVYTDAFSDLRLNHNKILSGDFFLEHGAMVSLGDVPLENVRLADRGLKFLVDLQPSKKYKDAADLALRLRKGIENDGYTYSDRLEFSENKTYALRVIAYQYSPGQVANVPDSFADRKNRMDLIVVFRAIRRDENGRVTILWKELRREKAPTLSFGSNEYFFNAALAR